MDPMEKFKQLRNVLETRGIEFTPQMQFRYWNDPLIYTLFNLLLELMEERSVEISNWDPWED